MLRFEKRGLVLQSTKVKIFGIAGWRVIPDEPRHNTWHNALSDAAKELNIDLEYLGLKNTHKLNWIEQVLPDSILRRFPYVSIFPIYRILRTIRSSRSDKTVVYIFEGSFFWIFLLSIIRVFVPNCVVICNLFPSNTYDHRFFKNEKMRIWYRVFFKFMQKYDDVIVTFDTQLMTKKVNRYIQKKIIRFPVPASFPPNKRGPLAIGGHHRVLVNLRSFQIEGLHFLLQSSCKECKFVLPRGPLATIPLSVEFGKYPNVVFDDSVIPVSEYQNYFDSFNYMIFLYEPTINATGRLLDSITRGIPICVPRQATEWSYIAKTWGRSNLFDWKSPTDIAKAFNHPVFQVPTSDSEPPFTPQGSLKEILEIGTQSLERRIKHKIHSKIILLTALILHSTILAMVNAPYRLFFKLKITLAR